ncbi:unnamed protein product [Nezara viridula]|uniref:Uncharacterized protein n=1 Tax=Nezara viridula TaxID=85310 RepID=A0A9P0HIR9_NEZVI|nr:unnamed protein product [Nezara viridula]
MSGYTEVSTLNAKLKAVTENVSETLHIACNGPSNALYRIQEDVRRKVPLLVKTKEEARKQHHELLGKYYDLEYAIARRFRLLQHLLDKRSNLPINYKRLIYMTIIRPIWTYGVEPSNSSRIQSLQSKILHISIQLEEGEIKRRANKAEETESATSTKKLCHQ